MGINAPDTHQLMLELVSELTMQQCFYFPREHATVVLTGQTHIVRLLARKPLYARTPTPCHPLCALGN